MSIKNSTLLVVDNYIRNKFNCDVVSSIDAEDGCTSIFLSMLDFDPTNTVYISNIITPVLHNDNITTLQQILEHDNKLYNKFYVVFVVDAKDVDVVASINKANKSLERILKNDSEYIRIWLEYIFNYKEDDTISGIINNSSLYKADTLKKLLASIQKPTYTEIEGPAYIIEDGVYVERSAYKITNGADFYKIITSSMQEAIVKVMKKLQFIAVTTDDLKQYPLPGEYVKAITSELATKYECDDI